MNFNRMTVKGGNVYSLKPHWSGNNLGGGNALSFYLPFYATVKFSGDIDQCRSFIRNQGAEYMEIGVINA